MESTFSSFILQEGNTLGTQDWPLDRSESLRGVVLLVHGLGEDCSRYDLLAYRLNEWGFAVRGYDQYGHGESDGPRGGLPSEHYLIDDLAYVIDCTRARMAPHTPLILLGHGMGALVAGRLVAQGVRSVQGLVLSSPAFDFDLSALQKRWVSALAKVAPHWRLTNLLDPTQLSHDPLVAKAYSVNPLVHNKVSTLLARFMIDSGELLQTLAPQWRLPTLLLYGGADELIKPEACRTFAARAPASVLSTCCFKNLYHDLFNELEAKPVFTEFRQWLEARF